MKKKEKASNFELKINKKEASKTEMANNLLDYLDQFANLINLCLKTVWLK